LWVLNGECGVAFEIIGEAAAAAAAAAAAKS
jgi:hypothetical protein